MDPATKDILTVAADNKVYRVFNRPDGSPVFQPVRGSSANAPEFMRGSVIPSDSEVIARLGSGQISNLPDMRGPFDINPEAALFGQRLSSSYTGSASGNSRQQFMQPSGDPTNIGFGPGPAEQPVLLEALVTGPYTPQCYGCAQHLGQRPQRGLRDDFSRP
jgi:hypothetical protein